VDAVNMHEAKTRLSQLVDAVESGRESEVVIARNGKPAARLVPIAPAPDTSKRIGIAKGRFTVPDDWDRDDDVIAAMFLGGDRT
jgi:prevent-host-death family protein